MAKRTTATSAQARVLLRTAGGVVASQTFREAFPDATAKDISNLITNLRKQGDLKNTLRKGVYINTLVSEPQEVKKENSVDRNELTSAQIGESVIVYIEKLKERIKERAALVEKWRGIANNYLATLREVRKECAELKAENRILRNTIKYQSGKTLNMAEVARVITRKEEKHETGNEISETSKE